MESPNRIRAYILQDKDTREEERANATGIHSAVQPTRGDQRGVGVREEYVAHGAKDGVQANQDREELHEAKGYPAFGRFGAA